MSPAFSNGIRKIPCSTFLVSSNYSKQTRFLSVVKMTSRPDWHMEKNKLLKIRTTEERRKLYKSKDFISLDSIMRWSIYATTNKAVELRKPTLDDINVYNKIKINRSLNDKLSGKVSIWQGDITKLEVDAIVNAANSRLIAGGGVDGAIHRAAGPLLQDECSTLGGCPTGEAKITCGYDLPAKYVIHTVGPQDGSESKLRSCYKKCYENQSENRLTTIAFPCISTGIYGFPNRMAAHIALQTARLELEKSSYLDRVVFCTFLPIDIEIYETLMQIYFPVHEWHFNDGASITE